jgi:hypothetical protein
VASLALAVSEIAASLVVAVSEASLALAVSEIAASLVVAASEASLALAASDAVESSADDESLAKGASEALLVSAAAWESLTPLSIRVSGELTVASASVVPVTSVVDPPQPTMIAKPPKKLPNLQNEDGRMWPPRDRM